MENKTNNSKRSIKKKHIFFLIVVLLVIFFLFPRRYTYLDGGSVAYGSFDYGFIYRVEQRHRFPSKDDENGYGYYENGTVISVFGIEIYNNAKTDYNDLAFAPHSTEVTVPQ